MEMDSLQNEKFLEAEEENEIKVKPKERITWKNPLEFIMNVVGYSVGLGNVWRFSYLCFKNGGGAFLIPYTLVAIFCALPLLFQEIALGQFTKQGCIGAWRISPLMQGIGYSGMLLSTYYLIDFVLVMAWCIFYLVHSFTSGPLPWSTCDNFWNTENCKPVLSVDEVGNWTNSTSMNLTWANNASSSTEEFWNNYVLQKSDGLHDMRGFTNWRMLLCYLVSWIVCYLCIAKGIRTTGKVAYVTVSLPYIMMLVLLIRGATLEGAGEGILFYITPKMDKLLKPTVWLDAASQILFSLGVGYSVLYALGSYNKFNANCYKQAYLFVAICCGSSIFVGFSLFSFIGHMAFKQGKNISEVAEGGPGLVFEVYPAGVSLLPLPQLWSVIFFIMLIFIAIDSVFGTIEGCITTLADVWPERFGDEGKQKYRIGTCLVLMIVSLPLLCDGGIYIFEIVNNYGGSGICILWTAFFESVAIAWIYGVDKFFDNVKSMIGYHPHVFFKYCYKYFAPCITMAIFLFFCVVYSPLKLGKYEYPWWGNLIGWIISASVIGCVPFVAVKTMLRAKGTLKQRWAQVTSNQRKDNLEPEKEKSEFSSAIA